MTTLLKKDIREREKMINISCWEILINSSI